LIGPQLVGIAQFFGLLAGTILNSGNGVIRQLWRLTRARQLSHCGIQAELQTLPDTQDNGTTADVMASGDRLVALPGNPTRLPPAHGGASPLETGESNRAFGVAPRTTAEACAFSKRAHPIKTFSPSSVQLIRERKSSTTPTISFGTKWLQIQALVATTRLKPLK
jgi:hypothetical protein